MLAPAWLSSLSPWRVAAGVAAGVPAELMLAAAVAEGGEGEARAGEEWGEKRCSAWQTSAKSQCLFKDIWGTSS